MRLTFTHILCASCGTFKSLLAVHVASAAAGFDRNNAWYALSSASNFSQFHRTQLISYFIINSNANCVLHRLLPSAEQPIAKSHVFVLVLASIGRTAVAKQA